MAEEPKNKGGRPLKFQSVEELQKKIDAYFKECDPHFKVVTEWVEARDSSGSLKKDENGLNYYVKVTHRIKTDQKHYKITDLALALDTTRETLLEYEGEVAGREKSQEFADTIKRAKTRIQSYVEDQLHTTTPTGAIFNLKANFRWRDNVEDDSLPPPNPIYFVNNVPTEPDPAE